MNKSTLSDDNNILVNTYENSVLTKEQLNLLVLLSDRNYRQNHQMLASSSCNYINQ